MGPVPPACGASRTMVGSARVTLTETNAAIEAVIRIESARLIAGLAHCTGDVGLVEELAQDAVVAALEQWPDSGVRRKRRGVAHDGRQAAGDRCSTAAHSAASPGLSGRRSLAQLESSRSRVDSS